MNLKKELKIALDCCKSNQLNDGKQIYINILKKYNNQPEALANLAVIEAMHKNFGEAESLLERLSNIQKLSASQLINLINIKYELNKISECESMIMHPELSGADNYRFKLLFKAKLSRRQNNFNLIEIEKYLLTAPRDFEILFEKGLTLNFFGYYKEAVAHYQGMLEIHNSDHNLIYNYAIALKNCQKYQEAITVLEEIISTGTLLIKESRLELIVNLMFLNCYDEAHAVLNILIKSYTEDLDLKLKKGYLYSQEGKIEKAIEIYDEIIRLNPNYYPAYTFKSFCCLEQGKFKEGWELYQYRQLEKPEKFLVNDIKHKVLNSKIILVYEQGIGDQILFLRMLSLLDKKCNVEVILDSQKIKNFIELNIPNVKITVNQKIEQIDQVNTYNLGSIGKFLIQDKEDLKKIKNWKVDSNTRDRLQTFIKAKALNKKIVGISWKSFNKEWGDNKSIDLEMFREIINSEDKYFINLQYGIIENELALFNSQKNLIDNSHGIDVTNDISGLACLIDLCDYIITVSNVTAHIAGVIGKKTYLLTPRNNGRMWYWSFNNGQSLWYPAITIINQEKKETWQHSIKKLKELLG